MCRWCPRASALRAGSAHSQARPNTVSRTSRWARCGSMANTLGFGTPVRASMRPCSRMNTSPGGSHHSAAAHRLVSAFAADRPGRRLSSPPACAAVELHHQRCRAAGMKIDVEPGDPHGDCQARVCQHDIQIIGATAAEQRIRVGQHFVVLLNRLEWMNS